MSRCYSVLECCNLFSRVKLSIKSSFVICERSVLIEQCDNEIITQSGMLEDPDSVSLLRHSCRTHFCGMTELS